MTGRRKPEPPDSARRGPGGQGPERPETESPETESPESESPESESPESEHDDTGPLTDAERRRRRARVFGEVLPEGTSDDRGGGWGDRDRPADEWLRGQVPPHHG
jgi:hypothetical protein